MSNYATSTETADEFNRRHPSGFAQVESYPELLPPLTQAVDEVINRSSISREWDESIVADIERAAAAAALNTYHRMEIWDAQVNDAADLAREVQANVVAATAEAIAERVTDAATEVHNVQGDLADHLALVAANAASQLAASNGVDQETGASAAAALVVEAVSRAATVHAGARATAATTVAHAAATAAAEIAEESAMTARAVESEALVEAMNRHRDALAACYEAAAAAAAQVVLTHPPVEHGR